MRIQNDFETNVVVSSLFVQSICVSQAWQVKDFKYKLGMIWIQLIVNFWPWCEEDVKSVLKFWKT